jgi:hypothetical protein
MMFALRKQGKRALEFAYRRTKLVTRGVDAGGVRHLVGPSHFAETLKPFVSLDFFPALPPFDASAGPAPDPEAVTHTFALAGSGTGEGAQGLRVGIATPPGRGLAPVADLPVSLAQLPTAGCATVLLGLYGGRWSPIASPGTVTLLYVKLRRGQKWTYTPRPGQSVGWVYAADGKLYANGTTVSNALAIFADIDAPIDFVAESDVGFAVGSAGTALKALSSRT